ncbi:MAG: hypothetical protein J0M25_00615 [Flavobacteriales bacterium]|nr:hypothetical protein [Flavobacteriales bacterium]
MKKIILLLFITNFVSAQECKFIIDEVDDFTKVEKLKTKYQSVAEGNTGGVIRFSFFKGSSTLLCIEYYISQFKSMVVGVNDNLLIMLKDDTVIELSPNDVYSGDLNSGGTLSSTTLRVNYPTSIDNIQKIKNIGIKKIRLHTSKYYYDFDVTKEKWIKLLNESIDCFLNK